MQNKPNFQDAQMNVRPYLTKRYENKPPLLAMAKQTQTKPIYSEPVGSTCSGAALTLFQRGSFAAILRGFRRFDERQFP